MLTGRVKTGLPQKCLYVKTLVKLRSEKLKLSHLNLKKLPESSDSPSSHPPGQDEQGTILDAALAQIKKEKDPPASSDEEETKCFPHVSSEENKARISSALSFPQKLWLPIESDQFKMIWWNHGGNCVVIDEEMFKPQALGRKGPVRVPQTENMKIFIHKINP